MDTATFHGNIEEIAQNFMEFPSGFPKEIPPKIRKFHLISGSVPKRLFLWRKPVKKTRKPRQKRTQKPGPAKWITPDDFAELTGLTTRTFRNHQKEHQWPSRTLPGRITEYAVPEEYLRTITPKKNMADVVADLLTRLATMTEERIALERELASAIKDASEKRAELAIMNNERANYNTALVQAKEDRKNAETQQQCADALRTLLADAEQRGAALARENEELRRQMGGKLWRLLPGWAKNC